MGDQSLGPGNGYTWAGTDTGKETKERSGPCLSHRVVLELLDYTRLQNKGYIVYTDNFYTSPELFNDLYAWGFGASGTVRANQKGLPREVTQMKLKRGENYSTQD